TSDKELNTAEETSWSIDDILSVDTRNTISSDIYTRRPPKFHSLYARDSLEFIEQKKTVMPVQYLDNMEELLAFADNSKFDSDSVNENSIFEYLEGQELNTAKSDSSMLSVISTKCDNVTTLGNSFSMNHDESSNSG
ncbi:hypothetical protein WUBG_05251, partial [Wuchereria bancrofti]